MGDTFCRACGPSPRSVLMRGFNEGLTSTEGDEAASREGRAHAPARRKAGAGGAGAWCIAPVGDAMGARFGRGWPRSPCAGRSTRWTIPLIAGAAEGTGRAAQTRSHCGRVRNGDVDATACGGLDRRTVWRAPGDFLGVEHIEAHGIFSAASEQAGPR